MAIFIYETLFATLLIMMYFGPGLSDLSKSPICRLNEFDYQIESAILVNYKLYLIVMDGQQKAHIVHEIPLFDINVREQVIYLDNSNPMLMTDKWGFDPLDSNKTIVTAFGLSNFKLINKTQAESVIVFIYEEGNQVLRLEKNELQSEFDWDRKGNMIFSLDNDGYFFHRDMYWIAQECSLEDHFVLSPHKYSFLVSKTHKFMILKKIGPRNDESFVEWNRFSGFIFYNFIFLFNDNWVYVLQDNKEFVKAEFEHWFAFREYNFDRFFRCHRNHLEEYINDQFEHFHESKPVLVNLVLFFLLLVVIISFYIRSKIIKNKSNSRISYYYNRY